MLTVRNLRWWKILMDLSMNNSQSCSFCQQPGIPHYLMTNYCKSVGTFSAYLKLWSSFFYLLFSSTTYQKTHWRPPYVERTCDQCRGCKIHVAVQDGLRRSIFSPCSVFSIANTHHRLALPLSDLLIHSNILKDISSLTIIDHRHDSYFSTPPPISYLIRNPSLHIGAIYLPFFAAYGSTSQVELTYLYRVARCQFSFL